jgi:hypothetical protein
MSYIRHGQSGEYVDIPGGSNYYIYDNGSDIEGWSYGEFAALIGGVADEIDISEDEATAIKASFRAHFEGWEPDYEGGVQPPERGEIFCQCIESRISSLTLTAELKQAVQEWVEDFDALRECEYCGEELRPHLYIDDTPYVCSDDECELRNEAERYGLSLSEMREANERAEESFDAFWSYITEHTDRDDL